MKLEQNFQNHFDKFFEGVKKVYSDYMDLHFPTNPRDSFTYEINSKYIKIVKNERGYTGGGGSVHCFVEIATGNVLKAASWKSPVKKNPRSNIFAADFGVSGLTWCGVKYLR